MLAVITIHHRPLFRYRPATTTRSHMRPLQYHLNLAPTYGPRNWLRANPVELLLLMVTLKYIDQFIYYLYQFFFIQINLSCFLNVSGKKLKCPYCERLYGYETNLRAHIRQRHQGIRVPCPHCTRTFTRNNTVRRHIAREHRHQVTPHLPQGPLPNHTQ